MEWAVPRPPAWRVDWQALLAQFPALKRLEGIPQSRRYHSEGDVLTHTRLVCEMLAVSPKWRGFSKKERTIVFAAALLHDIGKLRTVGNDENNTLTSREHSRQGARMARRLLYEQGVPFRIREAIVNLIRYHQVPFWVLEQENPVSLTFRISLNVRVDWLAALALADAKGRITEEKASLVEATELFTELAVSLDCLECPAEFGSSHGRYLYFQDRWHMPEFAPEEDFRCRAIIMSGLPGAGKGRWIARTCPDLPVVSGDREQNESDRTVVKKAQQAAEEHLQNGQSFVWRGTNLSRGLRRQATALAADHNARIEIVYVERAWKALAHRSSVRRATASGRGTEDLLDSRWDVPDPWEADVLCCVVD